MHCNTLISGSCTVSGSNSKGGTASNKDFLFLFFLNLNFDFFIICCGDIIFSLFSLLLLFPLFSNGGGDNK